MALTSTIYRFQVDVSDVDRSVYETVEVRVAMHPSESLPYMLTRLLAYLLNVQEGLLFSKGGLSDAEEPPLSVEDLTGQRTLWIEVGTPSPERLHKAAKAAPAVRVYLHKPFEPWKQQLDGKQIHRRAEIEVFCISPTLIADLGGQLERTNTWTFACSDGDLYVTTPGGTFSGALTQHAI